MNNRFADQFRLVCFSIKKDSTLKKRILSLEGFDSFNAYLGLYSCRKLVQDWCIWCINQPQIPQTPCPPALPQSMGFIVGKRRTSRMESELVSSMTRRSTPKPRPPVGGMPYSRAVTKS